MKVHGFEVPHSVFEALCTRLDKGPATAMQLEIVAERAGVPRGPESMRTVDRWLQKQRKAGFIEFVNRQWQVRSSQPTSKAGESSDT